MDASETRSDVPLCGLLNIDKPAGITSRKVVDRVQRLARPAKAGHAGTLDPLATGVLVVCVGSGTRLIEYVQRQPKRYDATFLLGRDSPTWDTDSEVQEIADAPRPDRTAIEAACQRFVGRIAQQPPAFSALKVQGRRAYDLARAGQQVELAPRPVEIYGIDVLEYAYPALRLSIECGSGTYIRSLGHDLAEAVGTAAVMSRLTRTAIGQFTLREALRLDDLDPERLRECLQSPLAAVPDLPRVMLSAREKTAVTQGRTIRPSIDCTTHAEWAGVDEQNRLVAILIPVGSSELRAKRVFAK